MGHRHHPKRNLLKRKQSRQANNPTHTQRIRIQYVHIQIYTHAHAYQLSVTRKTSDFRLNWIVTVDGHLFALHVTVTVCSTVGNSFNRPNHYRPYKRKRIRTISSLFILLWMYLFFCSFALINCNAYRRSHETNKSLFEVNKYVNIPIHSFWTERSLLLFFCPFPLTLTLCFVLCVYICICIVIVILLLQSIEMIYVKRKDLKCASTRNNKAKYGKEQRTDSARKIFVCLGNRDR